MLFLPSVYFFHSFQGVQGPQAFVVHSVCHMMNCLGHQVLESPIFSPGKGLSLSLVPINVPCTGGREEQSLAVWQ